MSIRRIFGEVAGLKRQLRKRIENLYRRRVDPDEIVSPDLSRDLARMSFECGRQIGVMIARDGTVEMVIVGGAKAIYIPDLPKSRGGRWRLRGLRFIHTHLRGESLNQDDLMDLLFLRLDCIGAVCLDEHGGARFLEVAHLLPGQETSRQSWEILPRLPCANSGIHFLSLVQSLEDELERKRQAIPASGGQDRAILVSVTTKDRESARESLMELKDLAKSARIIVADMIVQRQRRINPKFLMGKGKLGEIIVRALQCGVDLLIFDQELNPSQIRAITDTTELRVIDRSQLILDIFAQRARTREGKIQVEMAQLRYLLPRLGVKDDALSRLRGGIGVRGPGETKLEINRRRIKDRIAYLERQLAQIRKNRSQRRSLRRERSVPVISIVGYTNAGKSTLLNTLTNSRIFVEDQLFATLDPTSRRLRFPRDMEVIITDTVGFIRDLPEDLVHAFGATLEELHEADLLLHVVDVSNPMVDKHITAVNRILAKLALDKKPTLLVLNKMDRVNAGRVQSYMNRYGGIPVSALSSRSLKGLIRAMEARVEKLVVDAEEPGPGEVHGPVSSSHWIKDSQSLVSNQ